MKKAYETYKDSGIEWIGNVPSYWELLPIRYYVTLVKGTKPKELTDINTGFPYLTMDYLRGRDGKTTMYPTSIDGLELIDENEILVLWDGANAGEFMLSQKGYLGSTMAKITVNPLKYDKKYFYFLLKTIEKVSKDYANGTTIPHFDSKVLTDYYYPCPSLMEQKAIAEFLDNKCGKIDSLVAELESQVADLEVLKKSEISHVVTKGLDSNVQMKDSDIEWIGYIPENWNVTLLKNLALQITDGTHQTPNYVDEGIPFISIKDMSAGVIDFSDTKFISQEEHIILSQHAKVERGDIIFSRIGTLGVFIKVDTDVIFDIFVSLGLIKLKNDVINTDYLVYYLSSYNVMNYIQLVKAGGGTAAAKFNLGDVANTRVLLPNSLEQQAIVNYLNCYCSKIDTTISKIKTQIADLRLYKQSLISEAVTGKIKIID